jgi:hypothetical protein
MLYMYTRTKERTERHMFYVLAEIVLLAALATCVGMLLRVTYPDCTSRRCTEHTAS